MNIKIEILLLIAGGFLRIGSVASSVWYFLTQQFTSELLRYLCGLFIIAPSIVFLLLTVFLVIRDCCICSFEKTLFNLALGILISIGGPLGIPLFVYGYLL